MRFKNDTETSTAAIVGKVANRSLNKRKASAHNFSIFCIEKLAILCILSASLLATAVVWAVLSSNSSQKDTLKSPVIHQHSFIGPNVATKELSQVAKISRLQTHSHIRGKSSVDGTLHSINSVKQTIGLEAEEDVDHILFGWEPTQNKAPTISYGKDPKIERLEYFTPTGQ